MGGYAEHVLRSRRDISMFIYIPVHGNVNSVMVTLRSNCYAILCTAEMQGGGEKRGISAAAFSDVHIVGLVHKNHIIRTCLMHLQS